ncbi:MAG: hypothetical protein Q4B03_05975 [Lachnospiraceae bacterium]|nr:hypothetical protein [Lachnospiraceae bacterium]
MISSKRKKRLPAVFLSLTLAIGMIAPQAVLVSADEATDTAVTAEQTAESAEVSEGAMAESTVSEPKIAPIKLLMKSQKIKMRPKPALDPLEMQSQESPVMQCSRRVPMRWMKQIR